MKQLQASFVFVASLAVLLLLVAVTLVLGGAFDGLQPAQAAFLGTLFAATISFLGLLAGALYNSRLSRAAGEADERKRELSCLSDVFYRVRALTTTFGLISRTITSAKQVSADSLAAIEYAIDSVQPKHFPDLRLVERSVRHEYHDLIANLSAVMFMSLQPIKRCSKINGVYQVHDAAIGDLQFGLQKFFVQAVEFRRLIAQKLLMSDAGPSTLADVQVDELFEVDIGRSSRS